MSGFREGFEELPLPLRHAAFVSGVFGAIGGLIGLIVGLRTHVATAWAAMFEIGVPAGMLGVCLGLLTGSVAWMVQRIRHRSRPV